MAFGLVLALLAALTDWFSVAAQRARVETVAKPLVMVGLAIVVVVERPEMWVALLGAVLLSLAGDVLLLPMVDRFVAGLASFLAAHLAYAVALVARDPSPALVAAGLVVLAAIVVGGVIIRSAGRRSSALGAAVALYVATITAMMVLAVGVGRTEAVGAGLFVVSDAVLGWNRFVQPLSHGRLATHVLYHVGQTVLILGFVFASS